MVACSGLVASGLPALHCSASARRSSISPGLRQPLSFPKPRVGGSRSRFGVRATTETDKEVDVDAILKDLQTKWDGVENKTSVAVYGVGAIVVVWLSSSIVGAVNAVPLLPKILELIGLGYSAWFVYRYLLFKSSREELLQDVEELKKKISS